MNSITRQMLRFNNKLLNRIAEANITEEDVDFALKYGFKYDPNQSPAFLLKYPKILEARLKSNSITEAEFIYLLNAIFSKYLDKSNKFFSSF